MQYVGIATSSLNIIPSPPHSYSPLEILLTFSTYTAYKVRLKRNKHAGTWKSYIQLNRSFTKCFVRQSFMEEQKTLSLGGGMNFGLRYKKNKLEPFLDTSNDY